MQKIPDDFQDTLKELRETLTQVMEPSLNDERGLLLSELLEYQLKGIEKFYALLNSEATERIYIGSEDFDRITDRYRRVLKFFAEFPMANEKSTYSMSVISDFYYILRYHTREWGTRD